MRIAIIGCGNMGTGLSELFSASHHLLLHDRDWAWTQELAQQVNGTACQNLQDAVVNAQLIFLAVKPQNLNEITVLIKGHLKENQIVISLLAGTPLAVLKRCFPYLPVVRMMPNLAMLYGAGVIGLTHSPDLTMHIKQELQELLAPLGLLYWLEESQMDALTSLTGSGPAFIFSLIEAIIEAGVKMGFQTQDAQALTMQMLKGCITLLEKSEKQSDELKRQIASPGGTTIAGLKVLESENVNSALIKTFLAAYHRAQELSKSHAETHD